MVVIRCPSCAFENQSSSNFCGKCGNPLLAVCRLCHADNLHGIRYCQKCGIDLSASVEPGLVLTVANAWRQRFCELGMDIDWNRSTSEVEDFISSSKIGPPDVSFLRWDPWIFAFPVGKNSWIRKVTWDNSRFGWWWNCYIVATRRNIGIFVLPRDALFAKAISPMVAVWPYTSLTQVIWSYDGKVALEINGGLERFTKDEDIDGGHELVMDFSVSHNDIIPVLATSGGVSEKPEDRRSFMQIIGAFWQQVLERRPEHFIS